MPVEKSVGDLVYAGTMNTVGALEVRVDRVGEDTTLAKIIHLVEHAQKTRTRIQGVADRVIQYFIPLVFSIAAAGPKAEVPPTVIKVNTRTMSMGLPSSEK